MHPIRIAPSLLSCDFSRIAEEVAKVESCGADWLHVDVMDGHFVPNITIGPPVVAKIKEVATTPLDVHLMIEDPLSHADSFLDAGADVFTFHLEIVEKIDPMKLIDKVKSRGRKVAMAMNPDGNPHDLSPFLPCLDMVLVMSVFPGFGGQKFMPEVLDHVRVIRDELGFTGEIEMDGGIGPENIAACAEVGTNAFVAGTAVFGAEDVGQRITDLR
ncbi:MAG: ribulose-phosphate 3-epimerase, partial [Planctomycetota bacterium]|nr:ribulose-phosphate 3-epimerase [Planctomycetota bacterium]